MPKTTKKSVRKTALKKPGKQIAKKTARVLTTSKSKIMKRAAKKTGRKVTDVKLPLDQVVEAAQFVGSLNVGNALELGNQLHNCINDEMHFTAADPATQRANEINAARYRVRMAVIGMSNAAVNISKNTSPDDVRVLRAKADLAGAEFDRALQAFEQLITS